MYLERIWRYFLNADLKSSNFELHLSGLMDGAIFETSSLSDFGNRSEKILKLRLFLFGFEANIEIFNDNPDTNRPILRFLQ